MADLPGAISHGAAGNKSMCHKMLEIIIKKNNKGWLTLHIQRFFCGEEECEMLEHVAERRFSQKDVAEDAITARDHGKDIARTPRDGWGRPHSALLFLSVVLGSLSLLGCQGLSGFGFFLCSFLAGLGNNFSLCIYVYVSYVCIHTT